METSRLREEEEPEPTPIITSQKTLKLLLMMQKYQQQSRNIWDGAKKLAHIITNNNYKTFFMMIREI